LTNVVAVAGGAYHSLALKADGTVVAWGAGTSNALAPNYGQAMVPAGLTNVVAVAAGFYHSLALKADGTMVAWGSNSYGQTNVPVDLTNVVALAAGLYHSLALRADGSVVAWGNNSSGQTNIPTGLANAVELAGGGYHNLVLESDGRPALTVQPYSQVAIVGTSVTLAAMAVGVQPLSYQWQCNGTNVAGATTAQLTLPNVQISSGGTFSVAVTNALGTVNSSNALLTVIGAPIITTQPRSLSLNQGSDAAFSVTARGALPLSYQWVFKGTNIPGATASGFTRVNAQAADSGDYSVVVTNAFGAAVSSNATLTVLVPPGITTQPSNQTVVLGTNASFTVTATGTAPLAYQWVFGGTNLAGATADTLLLATVQAVQAGSYAVIITNVAGSITSTPAILTVLVGPRPILTISLTASTNISISFTSELGANYLLEYKHALEDPAWTPLSAPVPATGGPMALHDTNAPASSRYYRLRRN
jgi:hypothetical protein